MSDAPFLSVSFNQDGTAFVAGTRAGLRAYSVAPAGEVAEVVSSETKYGQREGGVCVG